MKRDLELVKELLIMIEEHDNNQPFQITREEGYKYSHEEIEEIQYNLKLMIDAGLIEGEDVSTFESSDTLIQSLTWAGHDFLDAARNQNVWNKADDQAKKKGSKLKELPFDVAKALLIASSKQLFGL